MNRVVELYEANHLMVLVIVFIGFIIYISAIKNKINYQNQVEVEEENEDEIDAIEPRIYVGSKLRIKYILTDEEVEIHIYEGHNMVFGEVKHINNQMPLAVSLLGKKVGDIVKFKKTVSDKKYLYVEIIDIEVHDDFQQLPDVDDEENLPIDFEENTTSDSNNKLDFNNKEIIINDLSKDTIKQIIHSYMILGWSHRKIEMEILKIESPARGGGFVAMKILHSYNIIGSRKRSLMNKDLKVEFDNETDPRIKEAINLLIS